jgi:hypothetical protein
MSSTPLMYQILNPIMKTILRSPFHSIVSAKIMIITFTGVKSGKEYSTPVSYFMDGNTVYCFTRARWWRNLAEGADVRARIGGQDRDGYAVAEAEDVAQISAVLAKTLSSNPSDARYYGVTIDADGEPNEEEINKAAADVVLIKISLK